MSDLQVPIINTADCESLYFYRTCIYLHKPLLKLLRKKNKELDFLKNISIKSFNVRMIILFCHYGYLNFISKNHKHVKF
jgi:hypothetical protein